MNFSLHHLGINTLDIKRLQWFYETAFGFENIYEHDLNNRTLGNAAEITGVPDPVAHAVALKAGNCFLELFQWDSPRGRSPEPLRPFDVGYTHLCFSVLDIDAEYERLTGLGVEFVHDAPVETKLDGGVFKSVYGKDPDGNLIELVQTPVDDKQSLQSLQAVG